MKEMILLLRMEREEGGILSLFQSLKLKLIKLRKLSRISVIKEP